MRHRVQDHLFAAAGMTAALSLIGTGVTMLNGSVLRFDAWPLVAGESPRKVELPVAPVVATPPAQASVQHQSVFGAPSGPGATLLTGGVPATLSPAITAGSPTAPAAEGGAGVGSLSFSVPAGQDVRPNIVVRTAAGATLKLDGSAGSLGSASSDASDGLATPVVTAPGVTGTTRTSLDVDGDDVPDTWQTDHGTPDAAAETVSATVQARETPSAFRADPPPVDLPVPVTEDPAPSDTPATGDGTTPAPSDSEVPSTDQPAPSTDPVPSDPAPPADSTPSTEPSGDAPTTQEPPAPAPEPVPADPAPPTDPAPAPEPAPSDPAPAPEPAPAEPAPADPAPAPEPTAASSPAPASDPAPATDPAPAPPASDQPTAPTAG